MGTTDVEARNPRRRAAPPTAVTLISLLLLTTWCRQPHDDDYAADPVDAAAGPTTDAGANAGDPAATPMGDRGGTTNPAQFADGSIPPGDAATGPVGPPPPPPPPAGPAVLTYRNDNFRTGQNLAEQQLTVASVRSRGMALAFANTVDDQVSAQALYVPGVTMNRKTRDVAYVATLSNTVYAFDVNEPGTAPMTSTKLWQATFADPENPAARPLPRGIYSTPVIDLASNTLYLVHSTRNIKHDSGKLMPAEVAALDVEFFLVAVDIRTGAQLRSKKISGTYPRADGTPVAFEARNHWCRPGLLLDRGSLYVACGMRSDEDTTVYHGWVFRYDAASFTPQGVFCTSPDVTAPGDGASIWMSGSALAEDPDGNVYFITANGPADFAHHIYGDALVKLSTKEGGLAFAGAFTSEGPDGKLERHDVDFGSGGALVFPDAPFVFGAGKTGIGYLLARDGMQMQQQFAAAVNQYDPTAPVDIFWSGGPHMHGTPAYFKPAAGNVAYVYTWGEQDYLRRHVFDLAAGRFDPSRAIAGKVLGPKTTMPGGSLSITANGNQPGTAIVWATLPGPSDIDPRPPATLLAQDAETLDVLWQTTFPTLSKWVPPTVAGGKLFLVTGAGKFFIYQLGPMK